MVLQRERERVRDRERQRQRERKRGRIKKKLRDLRERRGSLARGQRQSGCCTHRRKRPWCIFNNIPRFPSLTSSVC